MTYQYQPRGVCSRNFEIELDDSKTVVKSVRITGGCPGNTIGVSKLVAGRPVAEVINLLSGIKCGTKPTSCPDQLAQALREITAK